MVRVLFIANGFAKNYLAPIKNVLQGGQAWVVEAIDVLDCDVVVALCTIVSRVGTDVEAALRDIPPTTKPTLLVVLHHTFDSDYMIPNTQRFVEQGRMVTADLLFNEDDGLLTCSRNEDSLKKATDFLRRNESYRPTLIPIGRNYAGGYSIRAIDWRKNTLVLVLLGLFIGMLIVLMFWNLLN